MKLSPDEMKIWNVFSEMMSSNNLVSVTAEDIDKVLSRGTAICSKPKSPVKGAIIFLKGRKDLTMDTLANIGEKITTPLPKGVEILWGVKVEERKKNECEVVYVC